MWHKNNNNLQKCVKRVFPVLGHSYNAAWIQRLEEFGWDLLLKELADIKCAMYICMISMLNFTTRYRNSHADWH